MSLLKTFAEKYRIRIRQRADGERVMIGRDGEIYEAMSARLGVIFMPPKWTPKRWNAGRKNCEALGMVCSQNGDSEGTLLFDPAIDSQCKAAIKLAHVKRRRQMSEAQLLALAKAREKSQQNPLDPSTIETSGAD